MPSSTPYCPGLRPRLLPAWRGLVATLVCLVGAAPSAAAQARWSPLVTVGFGIVPGEDYQHRHGSVAGSAALFRRLGSVVDLGLEAGYQHFGAGAQELIGVCPSRPADACVGQVTAVRRARGDLWYVGPTLRVRVVRTGAVRPFLLVGLGRYGSGERTAVVFRDDRGVAVPNPESYAYGSEFGGAGVNAGLGFEGGRLGRLRWTLGLRAHGAIGGMDGELASVASYALTAGLTLP